MNNPYENLAWLPKPPAEFTQMLSAAVSGSDLRRLARFSLDENQLRKLSKQLKKLKDKGVDLSQLKQVSMGIISNGTINLLPPSLIGTALRFGISLNVTETDFNQIAQEAFRGYVRKLIQNLIT